MMTSTQPRETAQLEALLEPEEIQPFDPVRFLFTTATVTCAREIASALGQLTDVWELRGRYYPVRRGSPEADILQRAGAEIVPRGDDALHAGMDTLLFGLQRLDAPR
jgi:hypothetical protein